MGSYEIRETVERVERAMKDPAERKRWEQVLQSLPCYESEPESPSRPEALQQIVLPIDGTATV